MAVVSNATPLIYLAKVTHLDLLRKTYNDVYICTDVWEEAIYPIFYARPVPKDIPIILQARADGWLKLRDVETAEAKAIRDELLAQGLGTGESNSIALAKELKYCIACER
jgi:predicted nucleic acid-binding protein